MRYLNLKKIYKNRHKLSEKEILAYQNQGIIIEKSGISVINKFDFDAEICKRLNGKIMEDGLCHVLERIYPPLKDVRIGFKRDEENG